MRVERIYRIDLYEEDGDSGTHLYRTIGALLLAKKEAEESGLFVELSCSNQVVDDKYVWKSIKKRR